MAVAGVCFIGKQNEPLALRLYDTSEDELAFQFASFASLDVIEERFASAAGADLDAISAGVSAPGAVAAPRPAVSSSPYLGLLGPALCLSSDLIVAAYAPSTGLKILVFFHEREDLDKRGLEIANVRLRQKERLSQTQATTIDCLFVAPKLRRIYCLRQPSSFFVAFT
eukprot:GHVT01022205.1.p1 GENE.GHVT01022205.1~~GHVT01022205.1.p1  ORF type:complete len:168 (+),score=31.69 GHVT01022205.1:317-820(+)